MKPSALLIAELSRSRPLLAVLCLSAVLVNPAHGQENAATQKHTTTTAATVNHAGAADRVRSTDRARQQAVVKADGAGTGVMAAHPVVYGLLEALTQGSSIAPLRATPANLPPSRHYSYLSGRGAKAFDRALRQADAVVGLRSIWPDDPLYPLARQHNIRVVEIDAANPIDHRLAGIAATSGADTVAAYPWLNPVNMGRMADIIASEIQRLQPDAGEVVEKNLAHLRQRLVKVNAQAESALVDAPNLSVIVLSPRLETLANALNLDVVPVKTEKDWNEQTLSELSNTIKDNDVRVVLLHEAASAEVAAAISAAGAKAVVVETDGDDPVAVLEVAGKSLVQALATDGSK